MKKKYLYIGLLITILFTLTGCFNKKALTTEEFIKICEKNDFVATDVKQQFIDFDYVKEATVAVSKEGWQIEFYVLSDTYNAQEMYTKNKNKFELEDSVKKTSTINLSNYTKYVQQSDNSYKLVSRIDNTLIYVSESVSKKDKIDKFMKKLGY